MSNIENVVVDIVALSGGRLVGRTRLQKTVYLLDALGLQSGAFYYYYNFGPFSDDVADAVSESKFSGSLSENVRQRQSDGSPFSVFETSKVAQEVGSVGEMSAGRAGEVLSRLNTVSATILELAATIHWLVFVEGLADWRSELRNRKGAKTENGRMDEAANLLRSFDIAVV